MTSSFLASTLNLFILGTSFTVAGVYILLGDVVANNAGPGVIVSFLIAGFATLLAGKFAIYSGISFTLNQL